MFYIIGGAPRSGKSILAKKMVVEKQVPYFPLDALIGTLTFAAPEFDINHDIPFTKKSENVWKFTQHLFNHFLNEEESYLVEGDCILPSSVHEFQKENPNEVRAIFLGYTNLNVKDKLQLIRKYNQGETDWTNGYDDEDMLPMVDRMIEYSKFLKEECAKYNIPYFDVSGDFEKIHDEAYKSLTS